MATAKKTTAAPAATKKPGTALVPWEQQMAAAAARQKAAEKPVTGLPTIGTRGGVLTVDGSPVKGNVLRGIVLGAVHENAYYEGDFDPDQPTVPVCYAFADPTVEDPEAAAEAMAPVGVDSPQADACTGCPMNEFGTADRGRGKACKNIRRLILVTEDSLESPEKLAKAEMRMLKVPVTSVKHWANYVRNVLVDELGRPSFAVVTQVSGAPDPKTQFRIDFEMAEVIPFTQALWDAMQKKVHDATKALLTPYPHQADLNAMKAADAGNKRPVKGQQRMQPQGRVAQKAVAGKGVRR